MLKHPMEFMKYDKISDDVYLIGPNTILRFNVSLSKIMKNDGKRYHFYKEFEYGSRAQGFPTLITAKRSYDYYLSIENVQKNKITDEKAYIRIGPYDFYRFKSQLDQVYQWFTDKRFSKLFVKNKGRVILTSPVPESVLGGYPQNRFLRFVPTVIEKAEGRNMTEPGVELNLSNYNNTVSMDVNRFMGLYYTINTFNMYLAAQNLIGYLGFPEGLNRVDMGTNAYGNQFTLIEDEPIIEGINDRVIGGKKNISSLE